MKKRLIFAIALFIGFSPVMALAYTHHARHHPTQVPSQPTPPVPVLPGPVGGTGTSSVPVIPPPPTACHGFAWNVGQEASASVSTETPIMNTLKALGVSCVRVAAMSTYSPIEEQIGLLYLHNGFYVIIVDDAATLSPSTLAAYNSGVLAGAQHYGADRFPELAIGNEQEYRLSGGLTIANWIAYTKILAQSVKAGGFKGKVSYSTSGDFVDPWISAGALGALDALGENLYCGHDCNENYIKKAIAAWGASHVEITETNCDIPNVGGCQSDAGLKSEIQLDLVKLHAEFPTIPFYVFATQTGGDEKDTRWSMMNYPNAFNLLTH